MLVMTRHKHTHTGLVTPSLPQLLLTAMLHLCAMLVSSVSSTLQMTRRRLAAECHSDVTPTVLPREKTDINQETQTVAASDYDCPIALMVSSTQSVRPSNHEGVLTTVSHTHHGSGPPVRIPREGGDPVLLKQEAREALQITSRKGWIPAFAGNTAEKSRPNIGPT